MLKIQAAMLALRKRTGVNYAAAVRAGAFQLQVVTYGAKGRAVITPITGWVDAQSLIDAAAQRPA